MKKNQNLHTVVVMMLAMFTAMFIIPARCCAQSLFMDLATGNNSSNPEQLRKVGNTMYFITNVNPTYNHQLWKSDGSQANTVLLKDNLINTNVGNAVYFRADINGVLYYSINSLGINAGTMTYLWKTDGTAPVLVDSLSHPGLPGFGGGHPTQFTAVGNKIFFTMWKDHGRELWVTDGTAAGTMEVMDINPGNNGNGVEYSGVADLPMVAYNGKVYFQGSATLGGKDLYSSDGTAAGTTLVKANVDPQHMYVYNNSIYFLGDDNLNTGIWKSDGTPGGTVFVVAQGFNNNVREFNNTMFYSVGGSLWKSDGSAAGTTLVMDSAGAVTGILGNTFFTSYMRTLPSPPWYEMYYWKSDGTPGGTVRTSFDIGSTASEYVLNNYMYQARLDSGTNNLALWKTDGTAAGTSKVIDGIISTLMLVFNNSLYFTNYSAGEGYELWWLNAAGPNATEQLADHDQPSVTPNPSGAVFHISWPGHPDATAELFSTDGKLLYRQPLNRTLDLNGQRGGLYFIICRDGDQTRSAKLLLR